MATLPSNRTLDASILMGPAVHATGAEWRVLDRRRDVV